MPKKKYISPELFASWLVSPFVYTSALVCATLYLFLILISFNPHDPSWFYYTTEPTVPTNKGGFVGAHSAALLFFLFGSAVFCVLPLLCFIIYLRCTKKELRYEWDRLFGGFLFLLTFSALSSHYAIDFVYDISPGGFFGFYIHKGLVAVLGNSLAAIFLHVVLVISVICITRLSLITLVQALFRYIRFYSTKEYFVYACRKLYACMLMLTVPLIWLWRQTKRLFAGTDVQESGQSIVEFETIVMDEFHRHSDEFWSSYEQKDTSVSAPQTVRSIQSATLDREQSSVKEEPARQKSCLYKLPSNSLLASAEKNSCDEKQLQSEQNQFATILQEKLTRFGIQGTVSSIKSGPVITLIEYEPHIDSKISKIIALEDDLALALEAMSIRIIAPIPGRSVVGFEIANKKRQPVVLSDILHSTLFKQFSGHIPLALGKDTIGNSVVVDLVSMPHLLVAGSTGSGKSVGLNTMLISMLYRCTPDELKLVLIDPKRLEFASYADIPHLVFPIITDPQRAILSLKWVVKTMEKRYEHMAECGVRNIFEYQQMAQQDQDLEKMPLIVVMIDELSDLMMTAGKEVEGYIARIAQMARAAGIHLVIATQRPSVDVITGLIKVNFPSRISFRVTSKADSRTILDASGGDKLLGKGDMLFMDSGSGLKRIHGGYVSHKEVDALVQYVRSQQQPNYLDLHQEVPEGGATVADADDELYQEITAFIKTIDEVSISLLQRRFRIGYNRSARIIEQLETQGLIMQAEGGKVRKVIR